MKIFSFFQNCQSWTLNRRHTGYEEESQPYTRKPLEPKYSVTRKDYNILFAGWVVRTPYRKTGFSYYHLGAKRQGYGKYFSFSILKYRSWFEL
jgi:hypothetical protein